MLTPMHSCRAYRKAGLVVVVSRANKTLGYAAAWTVQLVFDIMVFSLTLWKLLRMESTGSRSLIGILLRDGACTSGRVRHFEC